MQSTCWSLGVVKERHYVIFASPGWRFTPRLVVQPFVQGLPKRTPESMSDMPEAQGDHFDDRAVAGGRRSLEAFASGRGQVPRLM